MADRLTAAGEARALPPWYVADVDGTDLRPVPGGITTVEAFLEAMRLYRTWAGNPSFRTLAARCRGRVSASGFNSALHGSGMPKLQLVHDFVGACGATDEYRQEFEDAWRRLAVREASHA